MKFGLRSVLSSIAVISLWVGHSALAQSGSANLPSSGDPKAIMASLFGVDIGKPLAVPLCPVTQINSVVSHFDPNHPHNCVLTGVDPGDYLVNFGLSEPPPAFVQHDGVKVTVRDGIVQAVRVETDGLADQITVLSTLRDKFGKPAVLSSEKMGNLNGATFDVLFALWNFGDGSMIAFNGALDNFGTGAIQAVSQSEHQRDLDAQKSGAGSGSHL